MVRRAARWMTCLALILLVPAPTWADQFELLDGQTLNRLLKGPDVAQRRDLSLGEIGAMPARLADSRAALVVVRTEAGNPARLLLVPELRKPPASDPKAEPTPVLVVDRLDTFDAGDLNTRLASRREIILFDGMPLDVDTGQVVPLGQGGDLVFRTTNGEPRLEVVAPAELFTLGKNPTFDDTPAPRPSPGRSIIAGDFAGRYRLFANGQWSGGLDLKVEPKGIISGRFRSDLHGTAYPVTGQVATDAPGKVRFAIALPRARQEFDGYLFGEGKGAMAGTVNLLDRTFGFFAIRDGGRYAPDGRDLGPLQAVDQDRPGKLILTMNGDGSATLENKPITLDQLTAALQPLAESSPWVLIVATGPVELTQLAPVVAAINAAGIAAVRFDLGLKENAR